MVPSNYSIIMSNRIPIRRVGFERICVILCSFLKGKDIMLISNNDHTIYFIYGNASQHQECQLRVNSGNKRSTNKRAHIYTEKRPKVMIQ